MVGVDVVPVPEGCSRVMPERGTTHTQFALWARASVPDPTPVERVPSAKRIT